MRKKVPAYALKEGKIRLPVKLNGLFLDGSDWFYRHKVKGLTHVKNVFSHCKVRPGMTLEVVPGDFTVKVTAVDIVEDSPGYTWEILFERGV